MLSNFKFRSNRLLTRSLSAKDATTLLRLYSDKEAMKFRGSAPMSKLEDAHTMIENSLLIENEITKLRLGIWNHSENLLVGTTLLVYDASQQVCEIGFSFGKEYWGLGYATETLQMIESQLKKYNQIQSLKAWVVRENVASVKLFENAGYTISQQSDYPQSFLFVKTMCE